MKIIILLAVFLSYPAISHSSATSCVSTREKIKKEFNLSNEENAISRLDLKNKKEYDRLKKIVTEIPDNGLNFETVIANMNDEKYVSSDIQDYANFSICTLIKAESRNPLFVYVAKNSKDKALSKDFEKFLLADLKNSQETLLGLLIKTQEAKKFANLKYGEQSQQRKNLESLHLEYNPENNKLNKEFYKATKSDDFSKYSEKEIKKALEVLKKDFAMAKELGEKYSKIVSEI